MMGEALLPGTGHKTTMGTGQKEITKDPAVQSHLGSQRLRRSGATERPWDLGAVAALASAWGSGSSPDEVSGPRSVSGRFRDITKGLTVVPGRIGTYPASCE